MVTMKRLIPYLIILIALSGVFVYAAGRPRPEALTAAVAPTPTYPPGREPMQLPANYREFFDLYAVADRGDGITRRIFISPEAVAAVRAGEPLPERTMIVIEAYDAARDLFGSPQTDENGHWIAGDFRANEVHMMEKRSTWWIEDLAGNGRLDGWNFRAFNADGIPDDSARSDCSSCHDGGQRFGFVFTSPELERYAETGETQYLYCRLPDRQRCR